MVVGVSLEGGWEDRVVGFPSTLEARAAHNNQTGHNHVFVMTRKAPKKTDVRVAEPRHRVGPKGIVSSGISFRDLPPPSLDEIKKICEHYQAKCSGTYKSLASRYVYQMATEIEGLVDALKEGGYKSEESFASSERGRCNPTSTGSSHERGGLPRKQQHGKTGPSRRQCPDHVYSCRRRDDEAEARRRRRTGEIPTRLDRRRARDYHSENGDWSDSEFSPVRYSRRCGRRHRDERRRRPDIDSMERLNLEDQNEEVLRWLREEMRRSQVSISSGLLLSIPQAGEQPTSISPGSDPPFEQAPRRGTHRREERSRKGQASGEEAHQDSSPEKQGQG